MVEGIKADLLGTDLKQIHPNLSKQEREALAELILLQENGVIVIQPADKGSGWCILDRTDYLFEANRQLNSKLIKNDGSEENYYQKVNEKTVTKHHNDIKKVLKQAEKDGILDEKLANDLIPETPKAGALYLQPKIHKMEDSIITDSGTTIPKARAIISGIGSNTERISWFVDQEGKEFVKKQESYIEDTPDLLRHFENINKNEELPATAKPAALDIKSMYTNIPINEGIEAMEEKLNEREDKSIPTNFLIMLLQFILLCNVFEFDKEFWLQLLGTAMGTRVASTYANIFMGKLEKLLLENCPEYLREKIHSWRRYIDDILIIWLGTTNELDDFHTYLNNSHTTIKFDKPQYDASTNSCNFLDLKVSIQEGKIVTDLFKKETSIPSALLPSSSHPEHISKNIVFSMAFRLLRICSSPQLFENRLLELKNEVLLPRNYKDSVIEKAFENVKKIKREDALKKVKKTIDENRIVAPMNYNPRFPNQGKILRKHYRALCIKNKALKSLPWLDYVNLKTQRDFYANPD